MTLPLEILHIDLLLQEYLVFSIPRMIAITLQTIVLIVGAVSDSRNLMEKRQIIITVIVQQDSQEEHASSKIISRHFILYSGAVWVYS
jgi:hypothetical protein